MKPSTTFVRWLCLPVAMIALQTATPRGAYAAAAIGQPAPALTATELDGTSFTLGDLRGQVVVINMWATWCGPCRQEMPALNAFYNKYHDRGVEMIGLSADNAKDRAAVVKAMAAYAYPAGMLSDAHPNGFGSPAALPMTYIIDTKGIVRAQLSPSATPVTEKSLADIVTPLLPSDGYPQSQEQE